MVKTIFLSFLMLIISISLNAQEIFDAVRNGDLTKVKELIENEPQLTNARNTRNSTLLHVAADINNEEIVKYLLEMKADPNAKNNNNFTPLFYAKEINIAKLLVKSGADINNENPLAWALINKRKDIVDYLIDLGAALPASNSPQGLLFLVRSLRCGSSKLLAVYRQQGFKMNYESSSGNTLLHYASESNSTELITILIESGIPVNKKNIFGWTPLHIAVKNGNADVVEHLVKKGADINNRTNDGKTPYNLASEINNERILKCFITINADQSPQKFPELKGDYLGQSDPGKKAVPFAPGILDPNHEYHGAVAFTPDGNEMYWSAYLDNEGASILRSQRIDGKWGKPEVFMRGDVPFISPDGKKFYYVGLKPIEGANKELIFVMEKTDSGWSEAKELPEIINSGTKIHWQASVDNSGNLYYGASQNGGSRIYCSSLVDGGYTPPQIIETFSSTEAFSPFISPDGSYLIFTTTEEGENLAISFKKKDGTWTNKIDLSNYIGAKGAFCPIVTHDGKYLFFVRSIDGQYSNFWVDASFIEDLRPKQ